jgi:hypothetical protein
MPHVVGIDTGLTCTGAATAGRTVRTTRIGQVGVTKLPLMERVGTVISLGAAVLDWAYLNWVHLTPEDEVMAPVGWRRPDLVMMEAPDTSNAFGGLVERIQLFHETARALVKVRVPLAVVPPAVLKGYATGNGGHQGGKKRIIAAVNELWPEYGKVNDDEADGAVLAAMGMDKLTGLRRVPAAQSAEWMDLPRKNGHPPVRWPANLPTTYLHLHKV